MHDDTEAAKRDRANATIRHVQLALLLRRAQGVTSWTVILGGIDLFMTSSVKKKIDATNAADWAQRNCSIGVEKIVICATDGGSALWAHILLHRTATFTDIVRVTIWAFVPATRHCS